MAIKTTPGSINQARSSQLRRVRQTEVKPETSKPASKPSIGQGDVGSEVRRNLSQAAPATGAPMLQLLQQNRSLIDHFSELSGGDKFIRRQDLEQVRDGERAGATPELRQLAATLLQSPAVLNALDTGAGKGDVDDKISLEDLTKLSARLDQVDWEQPIAGHEGAIDSFEEARAVLGRYQLLADTAAGRGGRDDKISTDDLEALRGDPGVPAELREAARFMLRRGPIAAGSLGDAARAARDRAWSAGRPLSEANNAHRTNTKGDMRHALEGSYNFLEGDIRPEINPPHRLEMRHDASHESGDNLYLDEWLALGAESGLGLKLDVKEGDRMVEILDAVEAAGVADDKLMFNINDGDAARWGAEIRGRFPDATIAFNPTDRLGKQENGGPLADWQVQRMLDHADALGGPATFVVRLDRLTDEAIARLQERGPVSVWNSPGRGGVDDVEARTQELRERGVEGVIDLRRSMGWTDKAGVVVDRGSNVPKDIWDKIF